MYNEIDERKTSFYEDNNSMKDNGYGSINEEPGNLFDYEGGYALAHCISADFALGMGIAKHFQARYSTRDELRQAFPQHNWTGHGYCLITNQNHIINLVTKRAYYEKPTLASLREALVSMKEICEERGIYKIAMPRIGCGLDKLDWFDVKKIIMDLFMGTRFEIRIVYLNEFIKGNILDPDVEKNTYESKHRNIDGNTRYEFY